MVKKETVAFIYANKLDSAVENYIFSSTEKVEILFEEIASCYSRLKAIRKIIFFCILKGDKQVWKYAKTLL